MTQQFPILTDARVAFHIEGEAKMANRLFVFAQAGQQKNQGTDRCNCCTVMTTNTVPDNWL